MVYDRLNVRVCIPFYQEFEACKPGLRELSECREARFDIAPRQGTLVHEVRNHLLNDGCSQKKRQTPVEGYDYFLMVDSDMGFGAEDVLRLLRHRKPVIAAPVMGHSSTAVYQCGSFDPGLPGNIGVKSPVTERGVKRVDWTGAAFLLISREALERMEYPWFRLPMISKGDSQTQAGEDVGFCLEAAKVGIELFVDFDVRVHHHRRHGKSFNWDINTSLQGENMRIKFGSETRTVGGMEPHPAQGILAQGPAEKMILKIILEQSINLYPDMEELLRTRETMARLDASNGSIELSPAEVRKLKDTFRAIGNKPAAWVHYSDLFAQLVAGSEARAESETAAR